MAKCKNCIFLKDYWCEQVVDSPDEEMERECVHFKKKTNAESIRAMSDEELAEFLGKFILACSETSGYEANLDDTFIPDVTDWLKQPVEEV